MDMGISYRKWDSADSVELSLPEASSAGRGRKALCLPESAQGKAIAILYVLLTLCFVAFTALVAVRLGNLSQGLTDAQLDRETVRRDAQKNLSDLQHYLELKMSKEHGRLSSRLLNVSQGLAEAQCDRETIRRDAQRNLSDLQHHLESKMSNELDGLSSQLLNEIRNLTHSLSQELAQTRQAHGGLQEVVTKMQEELQRVKGLTCTKCPSGWKVFENNSYCFSTEPKIWEEAKQACIDLGSRLVIVNTDQEQEFLKVNTQSHEYWLGLSDLATEGEWRWLDGSPLTLRYWESGEPNNDEIGSKEEDCVCMLSNGKWNDDKCSKTKFWICERPC